MKGIQFKKVCKIAAGSVGAMAFAMLLQLRYSASAGIITILSIQNTKRETMAVAVKRLLSFITAVITAYAVFSLLGFHTLAFGVYLLIFVSLCFFFQWQEGIAMNSVLITHFLLEKSVSIQWIINETLLFAIGVGIGVVLNLTLKSDVKQVKAHQKEIESDIMAVLKRMAIAVQAEDKSWYDGSCFKPLREKLESAGKAALESRNNSFQNSMEYYIHYIEMRSRQCLVLQLIYQNICLLTTVPHQAAAIAGLLDQIGDSFHEFNNVESLLKLLSQIKQDMKQEPLPVSREEFENRAVLLQILYQLEEFLLIKRQFIKELEESGDKKLLYEK